MVKIKLEEAGNRKNRKVTFKRRFGIKSNYHTLKCMRLHMSRV